MLRTITHPYWAHEDYWGLLRTIGAGKYYTVWRNFSFNQAAPPLFLFLPPVDIFEGFSSPPPYGKSSPSPTRRKKNFVCPDLLILNIFYKMCIKYGQTFFQAHYYKKLYYKMRSAAIIIQKVRFNYNAFFTTYVVCRVMIYIFFASLFYWSYVDVMVFSMREEELPKHFSKNSLRRRESKKNADEKKRGEEKRREEGMLMSFFVIVLFWLQTWKMVSAFCSSFKRASLDDFYHKLYMTTLVTLEHF